MKRLESRSGGEVIKRPGEGTHKSEDAKEAIARARQALQRADTLIGKTTPRTHAERDLHASRTKLMVWLRRLSLVGTIAAGQTGLYAGAEYAGEALRDGAVAIGRSIGGLGNMRPTRIDFEASDETLEDPMINQDQREPSSADNPTPETADIFNVPFEPDATMPTERTISPEERENQILRESALLRADELQTEGFFERDHNVNEFTASVRERLRAMGITGAGNVEQAQFIIRGRYRELVQERARHDVEGALRMARRVNGAFGGIDTYALALDHHRPDLAAETASDIFSSYRENIQSIRTDTWYADDPERRADDLNDERRRMIRDIFSESHPNEVPEVLRHLNRDERRTLAIALDAEIASLEAVLADPETLSYLREETRQQLQRLQSHRRSL